MQHSRENDESHALFIHLNSNNNEKDIKYSINTTFSSEC